MVVKMYKFKRIVPSRLQTANQKITEILKIIDRTNLNQDLFYDVKLILNELVVNGIKHGNELDSDKNVHFEVNITEDKITISVIDEGKGIIHNCSDCNPVDLITSGRGLYIVDKLTEELIIKHNKVVAVIPKG